MRPVLLTKTAEREFQRGFNHYQNENPAVAPRFRDAIVARFTEIQENPELFRKVAARTRRAVVQSFPYVILFIDEGHRIVVTAVFHTSRDSAQLQRRLI